jgi:S1-C subfamily serine protease
MGLSLAKENGSTGLKIAAVANPNPFGAAGLRVFDQIVAINGRRITSERQFVEAMMEAGAGNEAAKVSIQRVGGQQTLAVQPAAVRQAVFNADPLFQAGLLMDLRSPHQLIVQRVLPGSAAFEAGLERGDIITQVGNSPVANLDVLTETVEQASGNNIILEVERSGSSRLFTLQDIDIAVMRTAMRERAAPGLIESDAVRRR